MIKYYYGGGGLYFYSGNLKMSLCYTTENTAGGGLSIVSSNVDMKWCYTSMNDALLFMGVVMGRNKNKISDCGGGIYFYESNVVMIRCNTIKNIAALNGAGIYVTTRSFLRVEDSYFISNVATQSGGCIYVASSSSVDVVSTFITLNQASSGGGGIFINSPTSTLMLNRSILLANIAIGSYGGALSILEGEVSIIDCRLKSNEAKGPYFILNNGQCVVKGSCIYSTNFPSDYPNDDSCSFTLSESGIISATNFDTEEDYDYLVILNRNGSILQEFSGLVGPDALSLIASDLINWSSDESIVSTGFEVCFDVDFKSLGGGIYIENPGILSLSRTFLTDNIASDQGGGIYVNGGQVTLSDDSSIEDNTAFEGSAFYFAGGSFSAEDLSLSGSIAGASAQSAKCISSCPLGSYGVCNATLSSAMSCFFDCECFECPAGKYSPSAGSISVSTCIDCGSGYASQAGSFKCMACPKGQFAANGPSDNSGGIRTQTSTAATSCNDCPAGYYSGSITSIVCQKCADSQFSFPGNTSCNLCSSGYFLYRSACRSCLSGASCVENGLSLADIRLTKGHWRISDKSDLIYNCTMKQACHGGSNFSQSGDEYCSSGYEDPLCAICSADYYYSPDELSCIACGGGGGGSAAKIIFSPTLFIVLCALFAAASGGIFYLLDKRSTTSVDMSQGIEAKKEKLRRVNERGENFLRRSQEFMCVPSEEIIINSDGSIMSVKDVGISPEIDKKAARVTVSTPLGEMTTVTVTTATVSTRNRIILKPAFSNFSRLLPVIKKAQIKTKVLVSFGQIAISTGFNCKVDYPKTFAAVLNALKLLNLDIVPSLGLQCKLSFDYCSNMVVVCLSPLIVLVFLLALYLKQTSSDNKLVSVDDSSIYYASEELHTYFGKKIENYRKIFKYYDTNASGELDKEEVTKIFSEIDSDVTKKDIEDYVSAFFATMDQDGSGEVKFSEFMAGMRIALDQPDTCKFASLAAKIDAKATQSSGQFVFYLVLFLTYLVLVSTSTTIFRYFSCDYFPLPEGGERAFLFVDYSLDCESEKYYNYLVFAAGMVLIYPVGIPCMYATLLWRNRAVLSDADEMERESFNGFPRVGHLQFLVDSYKSDYFFFEVFECVRRLLLGSVIGMASADSPASALMGILISLVYTYVFTHFRPFKIEDNNDLATILAYSLNLLFLAALLLKVDTESTNALDEQLFSGLLCAVLGAGPSAIIFKLLSDNISSLKLITFLYKCCSHRGVSGDANTIVPGLVELQEMGQDSRQQFQGMEGVLNPINEDEERFYSETLRSKDQTIEELTEINRRLISKLELLTKEQDVEDIPFDNVEHDHVTWI